MTLFPLISRLYKNHFIWLLLAFFSLLQSCAKKDGDIGDYSEQFKAIIAYVQKPNPRRTIQSDQQFIDSSYHKIKHLYINDRFRYYGMKYLYYKRGIFNDKMALVYADSMMQMAKKSVTSKQYVSNYAEANFAVGDAYFSLSQYSNAYQCFYRGYFMGKNNLKNEILAEYTYRMGMVMFKQAHYTEAANYFKL